MIQRQTSDVEFQQGMVAHCREGSGGQEHINEIGLDSLYGVVSHNG